ncbi:MAG: outer membrane protein assembly factor BamE [Pseudomonadota bacterium]
MQRLLVTTTLAASLLAGCAIHQPDIQQGNLVTPEMREQVEPGMSAESVRRTLGTPMLVSPLDPEHWVYPYIYYRDDERVADHALRITFNSDGRVAAIEGDIPPEGRQAELASESEAQGTAAPTAPGAPVPQGGSQPPGGGQPPGQPMPGPTGTP